MISRTCGKSDHPSRLKSGRGTSSCQDAQPFFHLLKANGRTALALLGYWFWPDLDWRYGQRSVLSPQASRLECLRLWQAS